MVLMLQILQKNKKMKGKPKIIKENVVNDFKVQLS